MAESKDSLCEEPDDDFFDTFFDDGVLETLGEVWSDPKSGHVHEESSSSNTSDEVLEVSSLSGKKSCAENDTIHPDRSKSQESTMAANKCDNINMGSTQTDEEDKNINYDKNTVKMYTEISIKNPLSTSNVTSDCGAHKNDCSRILVDFKMSGPTDLRDLQRELNERHLSPESKQYLSINEEPLAKVKTCLQEETPASGRQESEQSKVTVDSNNLISHNLSSEKADNMIISKKGLQNDPALRLEENPKSSSRSVINLYEKNTPNQECELQNLPVNDDLGPMRTSRSTTTRSNVEEELEDEEEEEGEIKENCKEYTGLLDSSTSSSSLELTPLKVVPSDTEFKRSRDETEKENDLVSDEVCAPKNNPQSILERKNKIKINLKTHILASTTILNKSASSSKEDCSSPGRSKCESMSSKSLPQSKEVGRKRKRDGSKDREPCEQDKSKHRSLKKSERKKRRSRRDGSPESRKSKSHRKREKYRRSRSSSYNSPNRRRRQARTPDRRKRRRSLSRSLSKSPPERYTRRTYWSPTRCRSRSRSRSYSPFQYRSRKSTSPSNRRVRSSRSRSRSPFINEIKRLKKQWDREDKEKNTLNMLPSLSAPSWNSDSSSTTVVSNLVSVSVESVQLHSASFSLGNPIEIPSGYQGCSTSSDTYISPHFSANPGMLQMPFMQSEYRICNEGNAFSIPPPGYPSLPPIPGLIDAFQVPPANVQYGQLCSNPPLPAINTQQSSLPLSSQLRMPPIPAPSSVLLNANNGTVHSQQSCPPQSSSILRKQLDILLAVSDKSTLPARVNPSTCNANTSSKAANRSLVQIECEPVSSPDSEDAHTPSQSLMEIDCDPVSSSDSEVNKLPLVQNGCELVSSPDSGSTCLPLIQTGCEPVSSPDSVNTNCSVSGSSLAEFKTDCFKAEKSICDPDGGKQLVQASSSSQESTVEVAVTKHNSSSCPSEDKRKSEGTSSPEHYDSDVIIEEMPPKPPPEVICISGDEANGDLMCSLENDDPVHDINDDDPTHKSDNEIEIYNLDEELNKIHEDSLKCNKPESCSEVIQKKRKKKRSKRKRKIFQNSFSEINNMPNDDENSKERGNEPHEDLVNENAEETMNDCGSVLKECRDMIDTLRIGRFVVNEDDEAETLQHITSLRSGPSNSPLLSDKLKVEFSYTLSPQSESMQWSRDVFTNTPSLLCIDVSTNTDNAAELKDGASQTDLCCLECKEKTILVKEISAELERMKKERDELLSVVCDITNTHSIPGLGSSIEERKTSVLTIGGEKRLSRQKSATLLNSIMIDNRSLSVQTNQSFRTEVSTYSQSLALDNDESFTIAQTDSMLNHAECIPGEPVVAYDYNHTSPIPFELQSQALGNEYSGPFRSH